MSNDTSDQNAMARRLEKVERQHRRSRNTLVGILVICGAVTLMGQALPKSRVVEAQEFLLKDAVGKVRGRLGVDKDGASQLKLYGQNGQHEAVEIRANANSGPGVNLSDDQGNLRMTLTTGSDGQPSIYLFQEHFQIRAELTLDKTGSPLLRLNDKDGKPRAILGMTADGSPALELLDGEEKQRAVLGSMQTVTLKTGDVTQRASSSLVLFDKEGKLIWSAP